MSTAPKADVLSISNAGTRRVVIGPGPRSAGGGKLIKLDTSADDKVPAAMRLGRQHALTGEDADRVRKSKVVDALSSRLNLRVG